MFVIRLVHGVILVPAVGLLDMIHTCRLSVVSGHLSCHVQDMIQGLHGMFPVKYGGVVFVTAGGTESEYSQSQFHQAYNL